MTLSFLRHKAEPAKALVDAGLGNVTDCPVCHAFTQRNLIQLHTLARSAETCPGCYFLHDLLIVLDKCGFKIPEGPWTQLLLTSWNLWGTEHFLTIARCQQKPHEHWEVPTILEEADFFEIFKTPGEDCPWINVPTAKLISGYTGSQTCINLIRTRLDHCLRNHKFCRDTSISVLPARVLEIAPQKDGLLGVRLIETKTQVGRYVCLSHRWIEGQTITTTTSNISDRRKCVPGDEMPKTFREAIGVTHALGFKYIWIDSLAINQDHASGDWLIEAPKMAQYYQNATLTISAGEATDGLFYTLPDEDQKMWKVIPPERFKQPSYNIYFRRPLPHDNSALHHRGWVFQEHLLSPRIAHFGKELIWECAELTACECGRLPLPTKGGRAPLHDAWDIGNVVSTYGRKQGHMMALSFARPETRYYVIPQPVFVRPDPNSPKRGLEISHWILTQQQIGEVDGLADISKDNSTQARTIPADSQQEVELDELTKRFVILSTGTVVKEKDERGEAPSLLPEHNAESEPPNAGEPIESGRAASPGSAASSEDETVRVSPPTLLLHSRWLDIVAHYTRRKLTFGSDILPALAGLAKQFQSSFQCDYYAGLWKDEFAMDLLWRARNVEKHPRPKEWQAPSWSWASSTAATDYYHLLMAFELDSQTFRYSISESYINVLEVKCVPLEGDDSNMRLQSARLMLIGALFVIDLVRQGPSTEHRTPTSTDLTEEQIESFRPSMEKSICLPELAIPEDDIRYFPLARCMDNTQETTLLAHDTGFGFITKNNPTQMRQELEMWWDYRSDDDVVAGELRSYTCLLVAKHESTVDTAYFSLLLKPTDEPDTYERVGLMRHEVMIEVERPSMITII